MIVAITNRLLLDLVMRVQCSWFDFGFVTLLLFFNISALFYWVFCFVGSRISIPPNGWIILIVKRWDFGLLRFDYLVYCGASKILEEFLHIIGVVSSEENCDTRNIKMPKSKSKNFWTISTLIGSKMTPNLKLRWRIWWKASTKFPMESYLGLTQWT